MVLRAVLISKQISYVATISEANEMLGSAVHTTPLTVKTSGSCDCQLPFTYLLTEDSEGVATMEQCSQTRPLKPTRLLTDLLSGTCRRLSGRSCQSYCAIRLRHLSVSIPSACSITFHSLDQRSFSKPLRTGTADKPLELLDLFSQNVKL